MEEDPPRELLTHLSRIVSFFATFVGGWFVGWLSHRFALSRDRRREFNEVADRVVSSLRAELNSPGIPIRGPSGDDFDLLVRMRGSKRAKRAIDDYRQAKQNAKQRQSSSGEYFYAVPGELNEVINQLIKCLDRW